MRIDFNLQARYPGPTIKAPLSTELARQAEAEWIATFDQERRAGGPHAVIESELFPRSVRRLSRAA